MCKGHLDFLKVLPPPSPPPKDELVLLFLSLFALGFGESDIFLAPSSGFTAGLVGKSNGYFAGFS